MKHSKNKLGIIGTAIAASIPQALASTDDPIPDNREFGKPRSIQQDPQKDLNSKLQLKLIQSELPKEIWDDLGELEKMWSKNNTPLSYMNSFNDAKIGKESKNSISNSYEHQLMSALTDPQLKEFASRGDYYSLLSELENRGLTNSNASSEMSKSMIEVLTNNKSARERASKVFSDSSSLNDYQFLTNKVKQETRVVAGVAVIVAGVALVAGAVYVVAATGVYVATSAAFTVGGSSGGSCALSCHSPEDNYNTIKMFANEVGNTNLASKAFIKMKQDEAKAAVDAALSLNLISIEDSEYDNVISAINRIIKNNSGVGQ